MGAFSIIFTTLGFIFELQEGFGLHSGAPKGVFVLFVRFWVRFGGPCWLLSGIDFGLIFGLILGSALGAIPGRLRMDFRAILAQFGLNFGSLFAVPWKSGT